LEIIHEDIIKLIVRKTGDDPLYVHIYNLGPSWQIDGLIDNDGGGDYTIILPKTKLDFLSGYEEFEIEMTVPQFLVDKGQNHCEDILKVFLTSQPTSFAPLMLPKIPTSTKDIGGIIRGSHDLSGFLAGLSKPLRGAQDHVTSEDWACMTFLIRTAAKHIECVY
jgi:hypothetical protein